MVERALARLGVAAEVAIHIEKRLPVQGGMGAGLGECGGSTAGAGAGAWRGLAGSREAEAGSGDWVGCAFVSARRGSSWDSEEESR